MSARHPLEVIEVCHPFPGEPNRAIPAIPIEPGEHVSDSVYCAYCRKHVEPAEPAYTNAQMVTCGNGWTFCARHQYRLMNPPPPVTYELPRPRTPRWCRFLYVGLILVTCSTAFSWFTYKPPPLFPPTRPAVVIPPLIAPAGNTNWICGLAAGCYFPLNELPVDNPGALTMTAETEHLLIPPTPDDPPAGWDEPNQGP